MSITNTASSGVIIEKWKRLLSIATTLVKALLPSVQGSPSREKDLCDRLVAKITTSQEMAPLFGYESSLPEESIDALRSYIALSGSVWHHRTFYYLSKTLEAMDAIKTLREQSTLELPEIPDNLRNKIQELTDLFGIERQHDRSSVNFHIRQGTFNQVSWPYPDPGLCDPCFLLERHRNHLRFDERLILVKKITEELTLFNSHQWEPDTLSSIWWGAANLALEKYRGLPTKLAADITSLLPKLVSNLIQESKLVRRLDNLKLRYELVEILDSPESAEQWAWAYAACNALSIYDVWTQRRTSDEQIALLKPDLRRFIRKASFQSKQLLENEQNLYTLSFWIQVHAKQRNVLQGRRSLDLKEARKFLDNALTGNVFPLNEYALVGSYVAYVPISLDESKRKTLDVETQVKNVKTQVKNYVEMAREAPEQRPLNILLCGPPGAGKSFFVEQLIIELEIEDRFFSNNLTQMKNAEVLLKPFEQLSDERSAAKKEGQNAVGVVFLDEIDTNPAYFRQYARLLMPMWDNKIMVDGKTKYLGPLIIFFGASNASSYEEFRANLIGNTDIEKGVDFLSRLESTIDIPGLEHPANRILVAASLMNKKFGYLQAEKRVLEAIGVAVFEHNARQLEQALCRCRKSADECFCYDQLPPSITEQLEDAELSLSESDRIQLKWP